MKTSLRSLVTIGLISLTTSCGSGGSDTGQGNPGSGNGGAGSESSNGEQGSSGVDCTITLASLLATITDDVPNSIPSWEQLECYSQTVARLSIPDFYVLSGAIPPTENSTDERITPSETFAEEEAFYALSSNNVFGLTYNEVPPYLNANGNSYYPVDLADWDIKMRAVATFALLAKTNNYRIIVSYFTPPSFGNFGDNSPWDEPQTKEEFLSFWRDDYIPLRIALAQTAEFVKAEYYMPWDIEPGQFVRAFGDVWLDALSDQEKVSVTQQIIDELYDAIRPHFTGELVIINYDRYAAVGNYWSEVNLSQWDQVNFSLYTEGDVETTENYLDEQVDTYMSIIERDGITKWSLQEITVDPETHNRLLEGSDTTYLDIEENIYQAIFDKIESLTNKPDGIGITTGYIQGDTTKTLVETKLNQYLEGQFTTN